MKIKSGISRLFWDRASHPNPRVRREGVGNEPVGAVCCLPYMPAPTGQGAPSYRAGLQGISSKTTWKGTSAQCLLGTGKVVAVVPRRPPPAPPSRTSLSWNIPEPLPISCLQGSPISCFLHRESPFYKMRRENIHRSNNPGVSTLI